MADPEACRRVAERVKSAPLDTVFEHPVLADILLSDPHYAAKLGGEPPRGFVKRRNSFGGYTLYAVLGDGAEVDISLAKLCGARRESHRKKVLHAFRRAIRRNVHFYKARHGIPGWQPVYHDPPLAELVDRFLAERGLSTRDVAVVEAPDGGWRLADRRLEAGFTAFHRRHARFVPGRGRRAPRGGGGWRRV